MKYEAFGKRFKSACTEKNLPTQQDELGKIFGVSGPTVHNWRSGKKLPKMENAVIAAERLQVCVEWLLTGRGPKRPGKMNDARLQRIIDRWDTLTPGAQESILVIVVHGRRRSDYSWEENLPPPPDQPQHNLLSKHEEED